MWDWEDIFGSGDWGYDDPYANWGGGAGGDGTDGSGDWLSQLFGHGADNPYLPYGEGSGADDPAGAGFDQAGSSGPQFDWGAYTKDGDKYLQSLLKGFTQGSGSSKGGSDWLSSLFGGSKGGGLDLGSLLALGGLLGGGLYGANTTKEAGQKIENAAKDANKTTNDLLMGAAAGFKPYMDTGTNALNDLYAMTKNGGLADKFGPLTAKAMPNLRGTISLAELAARK